MRSPAEIADFAVALGEKKCALSIGRTWLLGVFAGVFIALAGVGSTFATAYADKVAGALFFTGGLAMVLVAGSELFTGNCLILLALLDRRVRLRAMLRNWLLVYLGNLVGAAAVAALAVGSGVLDGVAEAVVASAAAKAALTPGAALLRGILCNVLVCVAVWMSFAADTVTGKIAAVILPIALFVVSGFEHSVANMYFLPAGLWEALRQHTAGPGWLEALLHNLLPVTLGNLLGGGAVAGGYWLAYRAPRRAR